MIQITPLESLAPLTELKARYVAQATAPLDGMWLCGFVPMAAHFAFYEGSALVGYCCVNAEGYLLQLYLDPAHQRASSALMASILAEGLPGDVALRGAFVSTAEPRLLSLCLDHFSTFKVNALMYQREGAATPPQGDPLDLRAIGAEGLAEAVAFVKESIGADEGWLTTYLSNLIRRGELFGVWAGPHLIATGENRAFDALQTAYADLGMIVAPSERGRGLATAILRQMAETNDARGLKSICSTDADNIGAQTAIGRAGFFASNRIIRFE